MYVRLSVRWFVEVSKIWWSFDSCLLVCLDPLPCDHFELLLSRLPTCLSLFVSAVCLRPCLVRLLARVVSDDHFFETILFDVCMVCFVFVSRQIIVDFEEFEEFVVS